MKIAIVGSSGYIAKYLIDTLSINNKIIRIDKVGDVDYCLDLENPSFFDYCCLDDVDIIIFTAAISGPDKCASDYELCWSINVTGTKYFIEQAIKYNCKVLFFSSDATFGENKGYAFDEESSTNAYTAYGKMKKAIEDSFVGNHLFKAIRLSYVISRNDKFTSYCLKCLDNKEVVEVFDPFCRNCITIFDVLNSVKWLTENWDIYIPTFLNIAGKELISREDIVKEINKYCDNKIEYKIVNPDKSFFMNRPSITMMKSIYNEQYHIYEDNSFTEKMSEIWQNSSGEQ